MKGQKSVTSVKVIRVRLALMFVSLAVALTALSYITFSWFLFNRRADIGGLAVDVNGNFDVTYSLYENDVLDDDSVIDFSSFYPGQVHRQKLTIVTSNFADDVLITWSLKMPTALEEVPFIDTLGDYGEANYYYYLGSQIQVNEVNVTVNDIPLTALTAEGNFLVTTSSTGLTKGQVNGVASEITSIPTLDLVEDVTLGYYQTATIDIYFTFVDNGTNQNVYQNAWPTMGVSSRQLVLFLEDA